MKNDKSKEKIFFGIILIVIGILFFIKEQNYFYFDFDIRWEFIFIFIGVLIVWLRENKPLGGIFIFIGLIGFLPNLWPLLLIFLGLLLILKNNSKRGNFSSSSIEGEDLALNETVIFGSSKKSFSSSNFKGGKINIIFGEAVIDISDTFLAEPKQTIEINVIFGNASLIVPKDWNVRTEATTVFGDFSDKRNKHHDFENTDVEHNKILIVKGLVLFGGGKIN